MDEVGIRETINELKNMPPEVEGALRKLAELAELDQCPDEFDLKSHCKLNSCIACWFEAVTEDD